MAADYGLTVEPGFGICPGKTTKYSVGTRPVRVRLDQMAVRRNVMQPARAPSQNDSYCGVAGT